MVLKQFCQGVGDNTIDIANASRKIKDTELLHVKAGVNQIHEIKIGYDGIVLRQMQKAAYKIKTSVFAALAAKLPSNGKMVQTHIHVGTKLITSYQMNQSL